MKLRKFELLVLTVALFAFPTIGMSQTTDQDAEVFAVLDDFFSGWNARDVNQYADALHFPHIILNSGDVFSFGDRAEFIARGTAHWSSVTEQWDHTEWKERNIIQRNGNVVHVLASWTRFDKSGVGYHTAENIYVIVHKDGRWGLQARSGNRFPNRH